jgi:hypothetical protein
MKRLTGRLAGIHHYDLTSRYRLRNRVDEHTHTVKVSCIGPYPSSRQPWGGGTLPTSAHARSGAAENRVSLQKSAMGGREVPLKDLILSI